MMLNLCSRCWLLIILLTGIPLSSWAVDITLTQNSSVNYAQILPNTQSGGTVSLNTSSQRSSAAAYVFSNTATAGSYTVHGDPNALVEVSFENSAITGGGSAMTVQSFTTNWSNNQCTLNASGQCTLLIGANLTINANQVAGTYSGNVTIILNYV